MKYSILLLLIICCSCYTEKKAARQMDRAHSEHEIIAAGRCASWYPIRIDTVRGEPIVKRDTTRIPGPTVYVDCDSALKGANAGREPGSQQKPAGKVGAKCPDQQIIHDSVSYPVFINQANTAAERKLTLQLQGAESALKTRTGIMWVFLGLFILSSIGNYFQLKRK